MPETSSKLRLLTGTVTMGASLLLAAASGPADAATTHWTHPTHLKNGCRIFENFPKKGVPIRDWSRKAGHRVGVRYTYKGYAMVLDYSKKTGAHWGFIAQPCLRDPHAYSQGDHGSVLPDQQGLGGHGVPKAVSMSAPHAGKHRRSTLTVGSSGTLRSAPGSFPIGNLRKKDTFIITTKQCGHHSSIAWILGYAPASGRWAYLQAAHLPSCR